MNRPNESNLPGWAFLLTWWGLASQTSLDGWAFFAALAMMLVAWLAWRLFGRARLRLGGRAWLLAAQTAAGFFGFVALWPAGEVKNVLAAWGFGLPLLIMGALARMVVQRFEVTIRFTAPALLVPTVGLLGGAVLIASWLRLDIWTSLALVAGGVAFGAAALVQGWRFAAPPPSYRHDARFGEAEDFGARGTSHDL